MITPDNRGGLASKITRSEPFIGSTERIYPAHDVYFSDVTVLFELYDAKTNKLIMSREGNVRNFKDKDQSALYEGLCHSYFKDFRKGVKRAAKAAKKLNK